MNIASFVEVRTSEMSVKGGVWEGMSGNLVEYPPGAENIAVLKVRLIQYKSLLLYA